jgi:hypothetical protein
MTALRVGVAILLIALSSTAQAEDQAGFWSDLQLFIKTGPIADGVDTRAVFLVNPRIPGTTTGANVVQLGASFDLLLGSILRRYVFNDPDAFSRKYVMLRLGYRYFSVVSGNAVSENRPIAEVQFNFYLPESIQFTFRNRFDFRFFINGVIAFQYRPRFRFEREFSMGSWAISPYLADEPFYDGRFSAFVRNRFFAGVGLVDLVASNTNLELGYMWQADWPGLPPGNLQIVTVNFSVFF